MLGAGYSCEELDLGADDEGPLVATLIHRDTAPAAGRADVPILVVHGWSDYVFHRDLLEHLAATGLDVWALDLRKHGRSLRPWQTPAEIADVPDCGRELDLALARIGPDRRPFVLAHSLGGLVAAVWAARRPGAVRGLILNSPWLEFHLGAPGRALLRGPVGAVARRRPHRRLLPPGTTHYARSLHPRYGGSFAYDLAWKPARGHPLTATTLAAVLEGQSHLRTVRVGEPVLVLCSDTSRFRLRWDERMRRADVILDVRGIRRAARELGPDVQVRGLAGARHDVFLSEPEVTAEALTAVDGWIAAHRPA